jgi:hypothetical protein
MFDGVFTGPYVLLCPSENHLCQPSITPPDQTTLGQMTQHIPGPLPPTLSLPLPPPTQVICPPPTQSSHASTSLTRTSNLASGVVIKRSPAPARAPSSKPQSNGEKVPRPPNAWILYRKYHHADFVARNPGFHNNDICTYLPFPPRCPVSHLPCLLSLLSFPLLLFLFLSLLIPFDLNPKAFD